ncbi:MAG: hypothetical protein QOI15_2925 [Pseudonocardiales bacterium]|jgi:hypothetical protein|nr:hypothetical protein [Pseudonocardiales bacterium]MDT4922023.1 hypothetical protein [Pseudonocardiales bacterium]
MKPARVLPFKQSSPDDGAASVYPDSHAAVLMTPGPVIDTDKTVSRIETVMNLLLLANLSAASIRAASTSEHDRLHAAMVTSALDEALAEQRKLWLELAPTVTSGLDGPHRYRDMTRHELGRDTDIAST